MITRIPSGKVLRLDPSTGIVDGSYVSVNSNFTLFYNFNANIDPGTEFTFYFTPPIGTLSSPAVFDPFSTEFSDEFGPADQPAIISGDVVETTNWIIGTLPIATRRNIFLPNQYVAYVTGPFEFNIIGVWQVRIVGTGRIGATEPIPIAIGQ